MNKKTILIVAVLIIGVGTGTLFFLSQKGWSPVKKPSVYTFLKLPAAIAAQVSLKDAHLTGNTQVTVLFEEILDQHYKSLVDKRQELLFLAGFEQFLKPRASSFKVASFKMAEPSRPLSQVCSQYGVACERLGAIHFNPQQKEFLIVDNEAFPLTKLQQNTVPLLGAKTEVLNYLLQRIDEQIRAKLLYFVAKKENTSIQNVIESKIISSTNLEALADQELTRLYPQITKDGRKALLDSIRGIKSNQAIDDYLHKHVLKLPIAVNIDQPSNDFKTRWEWTPVFGKKPGKAVDVILFFDMFSDASRTALRHYLRQKDSVHNATFGVRPYFLGNDQLQWIAAEISMCVWKYQTNIFWKYLENSLAAKRDTVEADLYAALKAAGGEEAAVKKCSLSREMKQVVEYHLQSAHYLKIINTPVYFIGHEVFVGPLSGSDFEKMLLRQ